MAVYRDSREAIEVLIHANWANSDSRPLLFARVGSRSGEQFMVDYDQTIFAPGVRVLENLSHEIDHLCDGKRLV